MAKTITKAQLEIEIGALRGNLQNARFEIKELQNLIDPPFENLIRHYGREVWCFLQNPPQGYVPLRYIFK